MEGEMLEQEEESSLYEVKLEVFEGPMDLLLYLIRKDELDIYDIPIAHITTQYLGFLGQIHRLDIEQASDFILMAATLTPLPNCMPAVPLTKPVSGVGARRVCASVSEKSPRAPL